MRLCLYRIQETTYGGDYAQEKKTAKKDPIELYIAPHIGQPIKIAISGTPFEGSPSDLIECLESFADADLDHPNACHVQMLTR